jgi:hypothetical protein
MADYTSFKYLYPPRPQTKVPATGIETYERMGFWAQPKLNGSCALLFTNGEKAFFMGRHKDTFSRQLIASEDLKSLHLGGSWTVLVGEYMNKSQKDSKGRVFNGKFVIFDILVYRGEYLLRSTFQQRQEILDNAWKTSSYDDYLYQINDLFYRVKNITSGFASQWDKITQISMYEGFVIKRPGGKLESGYHPNNNTGWQVKCRKPTKNYSY